jgi:multiple sugar transport system ATP-binding protein
MIYVTHDQVEAMTMGDRIVVLDKGRVQQIDTPLNLYDHPANRFVAGFIGSPAMNFMEGRVVSEGGLRFQGRGGGMSFPLTAEQGRRLASRSGRDVTLGVRPEDVYVAAGPRPSTATAEATVQLESVEPMGNEIFLHAKGTDHDLTARVAPQAVPEAGEKVRLAFDVAKLHFFEEEGRAVVT